MPKIVVREKDQSTAGRVLTSNFSVFVAGQVADGKGTEGFDENGVCYCGTVKNFTDYVGRVSEKAGVTGRTALPPVLKDIRAEGTAEAVYVRLLTEDEFYYTFKDHVYIQTEVQSSDPEYADLVDGYLKRVAKNDQGVITGKFKYEKKTTGYLNNQNYCVLEYEGRDLSEDEAVNGYGNKVAYELLTLGYTVYYKKFTNISELNDATFWECAKDRSLYNFRYITHGLTKNCSTTNNVIASVANDDSGSDNHGRGDCIALLEIPEECYTGSGVTPATIVSNMSSGISAQAATAAYFAPYVEYNLFDEDDIYTNKFPACFHYLSCALNSQQNYSEWYAVAGFTRGVGRLAVQRVGYAFGDSVTSKLQPRISGGVASAINLIIKLPQGYFLWGNRTAFALTGTGLIFSHFLNIRQLCCTLKKQIYTTCRALTFDPNSDVLWANFCGSLRPLLERMKTDQGIRDYAFEKKETELKGKLYAAVRIVPIEAVEDFEIVVTLEDNLDNPTVSIDEQLGNY